MFSGFWSALVDWQLVIAGFALMLAAQQASVWRWEGRRSSSRFVVFSAIATAMVFITNYVVLNSLDHPRLADWLLFARSVALSGLALSTLPLATSLAGRPVPRPLNALLTAVVTARLVLWPTSDLVYRHHLSHGLPSYGPLTEPTGLALILLVFGYLCFVAGHGPSDRERFLLSVGIVGSLTLAVVSVVTGDGVAGEVLSGYIPLPALVAIAVLLWIRQFNAYRAVRRFADRQRALANLGRIALGADLPTVVTAAEQAVAEHTGGPTDSPEQDRGFAAAVDTVVAAARTQDRAREQMRERATIDELTRLPNRSALRDAINAAISEGAERGHTVAIALCDIDRFRSVNDVHGHPAGDEVLETVARRLLDVAEPCDVVGRFGGDEFVVVCRDVVDGDVSTFGRRVASVFERPIVTRLVDASVTASVGIAAVVPCPDGDVDADMMLRDADTAMYDAKERGGAVIGQFHDGLRSAVVYRADLERRLRGAVDRGEIDVHYQPIVCLADRSIVGYEALARWRQGDSFVPNQQWIPVAESTGLIHEIGEHVLTEAAKQLQRWHASGHQVDVSVNVSPRQLSSRRLLDRVYRLLASGAPPKSLILEVTETLAVDEYAASLLRELRLTGMRVALDDFGTGYSALAAVSRLPIDVLKIDRSIVRRVTHRDGGAVIAAVLAIASSLGLRTVAEGVEQEEVHQRLVDLGCEFAQGYLYAKPQPAQTERTAAKCPSQRSDTTPNTDMYGDASRRSASAS